MQARVLKAVVISWLTSGDLIDNDFRIGSDASIVFVPEPATILLLGLGAVMLRKRR